MHQKNFVHKRFIPLTHNLVCNKIVVMHKDLIASGEASKILQIDRSTLSRLVSAGKITPALKIEGLRGPMWFEREDVQALADERARTAA